MLAYSDYTEVRLPPSPVVYSFVPSRPLIGQHYQPLQPSDYTVDGNQPSLRGPVEQSSIWHMNWKTSVIQNKLEHIVCLVCVREIKKLWLKNTINNSVEKVQKSNQQM
jgi:hypothetical protein